MAVDVETFRERYPEFVNPPYTDAIVQEGLDDAQCDFSRSKLSSSACGQNIYERIIFALTAHELFKNNQVGTKGNTGVTSGPIQSKTVGKVSVSYASSSAINSNLDSYYTSTPYGMRYLTLLQKYCPAIITVC